VAEGYDVGTMRDGPRSEKILNQMPPKNSLPVALAVARVAVRAFSARRSELTASGCGRIDDRTMIFREPSSESRRELVKQGRAATQAERDARPPAG